MGHRVVATTLLLAGLTAGAGLVTGCSSDDAPAPITVVDGSGPTDSTVAGSVPTTAAAAVTAGSGAPGVASSAPPVLVINGPAQVDLTTAP